MLFPVLLTVSVLGFLTTYAPSLVHSFPNSQKQNSSSPSASPSVPQHVYQSFFYSLAKKAKYTLEAANFAIARFSKTRNHTALGYRFNTQRKYNGTATLLATVSFHILKNSLTAQEKPPDQYEEKYKLKILLKKKKRERRECGSYRQRQYYKDF